LVGKDGVAPNFREVYVDDILRFSRSSIDIFCGLVGFFSQGWLVSRLVSSIYDRALFKGASLQDLPSDDEGPRFIICAANLTTGSLWRFSRPHIADWRGGGGGGGPFPPSPPRPGPPPPSAPPPPPAAAPPGGPGDGGPPAGR